MRRRLVLSYVGFALVVLLVLEVPLGIVAARSRHDQVRAGARRDATVIAALAAARLEQHDEHDDHGDGGADPDLELSDLADRYTSRTGGEVLVAGPDGTVLSDDGDPAGGDDATALRADVGAALDDRETTASRTLAGHPVEVAAVPVRSESGEVLGAVVVAAPSGDVRHDIRMLVVLLVAFAVVVLGAVTLLAVLLARDVTRPLADLEEAAGRLEAGDLTSRSAPGGPPEVHRLGRSFNRMADRLEELISAQRAFLADASHQLRSPLTALRLRLEATDPSDADAARRHLAAASEEVARLSRLTDGLLVLVRTEGARPARIVVDAGAVARGRADAWAPLAEERSVRVVVDAPAPGPWVYDVEGNLEQVLDNLLANALEVAPPGTEVALTVESRPATPADPAGVVLAVTDAGPGIPAEQRAAAFERFWRDAERGTGRAGLGLAISRRLARVAGGDVSLHDAPGGGLRAEVHLEEARDGPPPAGAPQ